MAKQLNQAVRSKTLHIPHSIHLVPGEKLVLAIPGSRVLLYRGQLLRGVGLVLVLIVAVAVARSELWWLEVIAVMLVLALFVSMLARFINYRYNLCLLTNRRVINIERSHLLIEERRTETEYDNIREVNVSVTTLFERLFHIGTVHIETLSTLPDICLSRVDHPFDIQEKIYLLRDRFVR